LNTQAADAVTRALAAAFPEGAPRRLGIAISGGGDSVALAVLLADWARPLGIGLRAATVNHNLRPEAAAEASAAARLCARLGIGHDTLDWTGWSGQGNLQDAARRARQALLAGWARTHALDAVALGHTLDDQAETLLLRLARGSGVDGLSGMAARRRTQGTTWLRPLLDVPRATLRDMLRQRGVDWVDDPSNEDMRFDRVKARHALAMLAPLGIDATGLAATANRLAEARDALAHAAIALFDTSVKVDAGGDVLIAQSVLAAPTELRDRVIAQVLRWLARADYRPRRTALHALIDGLAAGHGGTLMGCIARPEPDGRLRIGREPRAVDHLRTGPEALWDGRWRLHPPETARLDGVTLACLGEAGLSACPDWRAAGLPRHTLIAGPAAWLGKDLLAAPLAQPGTGWRAELVRGRDDLRTSFLLH